MASSGTRSCAVMMDGVVSVPGTTQPTHRRTNERTCVFVRWFSVCRWHCLCWFIIVSVGCCCWCRCTVFGCMCVFLGACVRARASTHQSIHRSSLCSSINNLTYASRPYYWLAFAAYSRLVRLSATTAARAAKCIGCVSIQLRATASVCGCRRRLLLGHCLPGCGSVFACARARAVCV